jgi:membrane protease YdiL (CAAX protease family)
MLAIHRTRERRRDLPGMYAWMFFESTLWASALYVIAFLFPKTALSLNPLFTDLTAAIGAGIYEEALFRFVLMGGLIAVFHYWMRAPLRWTVPFAAILSACLFSYAHHAASGIGTEPWHWGRFVLRALLGALLGAIFWVRGLGIVVYTHALYNVAVILPSHV